MPSSSSPGELASRDTSASPGTTGPHDESLTFQCRQCGGPVPLTALPDGGSLPCPRCERTYTLDDGIVMLGRPSNQDDYPEEVHEYLAAIEPRHFWFGERNRLILATMQRAIGPLAGRSLLDVGCGTGFVTAALERAGLEACGIDMSLTGLRHARRRMRGPLICQDAGSLPFDARFDVVMLCDVIEHTPDDLLVLREAARVLDARGSVVVTVPAHPSLWTPLDDASGHKRRYTRRSLAAAMRQAGLRPRLVRYFNTLLLPAQVLQRFALAGASTETEADQVQLIYRALRVPAAPLNQLLALVARADLPLGRLNLPFGSSLIAVGSRS